MFTRSNTCLLPFTLYTTVRGLKVAPGAPGMAVGAGACAGVGIRGSAVRGGATVMTVSGGSARGVLGAAVGGALDDRLGGTVVRGALDITDRGVGAPTVALVVALSPLLMMTAVAMAPMATTTPTNT